MVGQLREEEFVAETFRMIPVAEKNEQTLYFGVGVNDDTLAHGEVRHDSAAKLRTVTIHAGVDGAMNSYVKYCSLRQQVERVSGRMTKTRLQVKRENGSRRDADGLYRRA